MKHTKEEITDAKARLLKTLKAGDTVYTILRHCSSSGMSRVIDLIVIEKGNTNSKGKAYPRSIAHDASIVLGMNMHKNHYGITAGGCGMDMGFHLVYSLGSVLWGHGKDGDAVKQKFVTGRNGDTGAETDGGYLLRHSWL